MAVRDGARYLRAALESVLEQRVDDMEFVIIDDGSAEESADILRTYARRDARIRLVARANRGLTASLNEAIGLSRGPLLARMDADDICMPGRLAAQVAYMQANPDCVLMGAAYHLVDDQNRLLKTMRPPADDASLQRQCLEGTTPICHPLSMFRRDAAMRVGGYSTRFEVAQDLDLWLRLGEVGRMACLPDVLLRYRMHPESMSETRQSVQVAEMRLACELAWERRGVRYEFKGEAGWRATGDTRSRLRQTLKFGWWAHNSGQMSTARAYGLRAIGLAPLRSEGYRLLYRTWIPGTSRFVGSAANIVPVASSNS